jgi:hypothetical protein
MVCSASPNGGYSAGFFQNFPVNCSYHCTWNAPLAPIHVWIRHRASISITYSFDPLTNLCTKRLRAEIELIWILLGPGGGPLTFDACDPANDFVWPPTSNGQNELFVAESIVDSAPINPATFQPGGDCRPECNPPNPALKFCPCPESTSQSLGTLTPTIGTWQSPCAPTSFSLSALVS